MTATAREPSRGASSLGRRLSTWLALQGLLAALVVSATVYVVSGWILHTRQVDELVLKQGVVRHALAETAPSADVEELKHKLDDFLAGHEDMTLSVTASTGKVIYQFDRDRLKRLHGRMKVASWVEPWPAGAGGQVRAELRLDVGRDDALLQRLGRTLLVTSLAGAAIVSFTGFLLVSRGLRPVRALSAQVESMALDRPQLRLDGSAQPRELLPLVDRFNVLLSRVERAYAQLEAFNADVAHELRTPLTTLIGASELALRRNRPAEELREVIAANLDDVRRLAGIVNDMLFLSQADRGATARRGRSASLASLAAQVVEFHEALLEEAGLTVRIEGDADAAVDEPLVKRALANLLGNAIRFAQRGSCVVVCIAPDAAEQVRVEVRNAGESIAPQHLERLFDRFFRVDAARPDSQSHHGLGLAIVAAIARMHAGRPLAASEGGTTRVGFTLVPH